MTLTVDIRKKAYPNGCCAIENLQFSAQRGEFIAIVGPSGAGKTTLLNLIAGLDRNLDGSIALRSGAAPARPTIGFMFQEPRLMPWLTVQQNLELVLAPQARLQQVVQLQDMLGLVGLPGCGALFPGQLSGGMQRRVALLRAFIVEPEVLLMDEPFQSLDAPTADQLRTLLQELWQRTRPSVLFVTHSLREALSLADRVLFLSARPSRIILDLPVDLSRPRTIEDAAVQKLHASLLERYPQLLEGQLAPPPEKSCTVHSCMR
ncbi:ABC transporter ATP-binding protein [Herminiimonas sp. CN]|uniref:ABC transporter ATP-binding protein n=1 Tax=Herminiimonas sp. CN TaxID=1349818 RepID=UPI000473241F|nr:ABC transporter ATP-binding protein [Herminiimonas sp. CN]